MIIMIMMRLMMTRSHFSVGVVLTRHGACLERRGSRGLVTVDTEGHQEYFANMWNKNSHLDLKIVLKIICQCVLILLFVIDVDHNHI